MIEGEGLARKRRTSRKGRTTRKGRITRKRRTSRKGRITRKGRTARKGKITRRKYSRKAPRRRTKRSRDTVEAYSSLSGGGDGPSIRSTGLSVLKDAAPKEKEEEKEKEEDDAEEEEPGLSQPTQDRFATLNAMHAKQLKKLEKDREKREKNELALQEKHEKQDNGATPSMATHKAMIERIRDALEREESDDLLDRWKIVEETAGVKDFKAGKLSIKEYYDRLVETFANAAWPEDERRWMEQLMQRSVNVDVSLKEFKKTLQTQNRSH